MGPLQRREPPIVSLRWRRISFIHTTWDRFEAAEEINDLFVEGDQFVDRLYHALRESDMAPERQFPVRESGTEYIAVLAVPCQDGTVSVSVAEDAAGQGALLCFSPEAVAGDIEGCLVAVRLEVNQRGGIQPTGMQDLRVSRSQGPMMRKEHRA